MFVTRRQHIATAVALARLPVAMTHGHVKHLLLFSSGRIRVDGEVAAKIFTAERPRNAKSLLVRNYESRHYDVTESAALYSLRLGRATSWP